MAIAPDGSTTSFNVSKAMRIARLTASSETLTWPIPAFVTAAKGAVPGAVACRASQMVGFDEAALVIVLASSDFPMPSNPSGSTAMTLVAGER